MGEIAGAGDRDDLLDRERTAASLATCGVTPCLALTCQSGRAPDGEKTPHRRLREIPRWFQRLPCDEGPPSQVALVEDVFRVFAVPCSRRGETSRCSSSAPRRARPPTLPAPRAHAHWSRWRFPTNPIFPRSADLDGPQRLFVGDRRVRYVQVVQRNLLQLQVFEAAIESSSQMVRLAIRRPFVDGRVFEAALGRDRDAAHTGATLRTRPFRLCPARTNLRYR